MSFLNNFHTYTLYIPSHEKDRKDMYVENFGLGYCGPCSVIQAITLSQNLFSGSHARRSAADYTKRISRSGNTKSVLLRKIANAMRLLRESDKTSFSRRSQTDEVIQIVL